MNLTDMKLPQIGSEKLEGAFLGFLNQFKQIYIGDQVNKSTKVSVTKSVNMCFSFFFVLFVISYIVENLKNPIFKNKNLKVILISSYFESKIKKNVDLF